MRDVESDPTGSLFITSVLQKSTGRTKKDAGEHVKSNDLVEGGFHDKGCVDEPLFV